MEAYLRKITEFIYAGFSHLSITILIDKDIMIPYDILRIKFSRTYPEVKKSAIGPKNNKFYLLNYRTIFLYQLFDIIIIMQN